MAPKGKLRVLWGRRIGIHEEKHVRSTGWCAGLSQRSITRGFTLANHRVMKRPSDTADVLSPWGKNGTCLTSGENDTAGERLTSVTRKRFPRSTGFSPSYSTCSCTLGSKLSEMREAAAPGTSLACPSEALRALEKSWSAIWLTRVASGRGGGDVRHTSLSVWSRMGRGSFNDDRDDYLCGTPFVLLQIGFGGR
jgi:hypothetical protein